MKIMTKQELDELKLLTINDLIPLGIALERRGQWKSIRHWESDKWKFECVSDTEYFKTESIFEAVDWFYDDLKPDEKESKSESEVKFSAKARVDITDEYIDKAKREAQIEVLKGVKKFHDTEAKLFGSTYMKLLHKGEIDDEYQGLANAHTRSSVAVQGLIDELEKRGE